jgi:hypothetical protein
MNSILVAVLVFGLFLGPLYEKVRRVLRLDGRAERSNAALPPGAPPRDCKRASHRDGREGRRRSGDVV